MDQIHKFDTTITSKKEAIDLKTLVVVKSLLMNRTEHVYINDLHVQLV